ncbi:MAG TPA: NADP-dependent oxidoreductase [Anaerolineae bacterium]|nr:NADP-dependent oxidoreductase [Anaerolineae bacterium]
MQRRQTAQTMMRAVAIDQFGGPEVLKVQMIPVPDIEPGEVLIRVEWAGVGEWDPFERQGGYAQMLGLEPAFPYVLGSEGAGTIVAVGEQVSRFQAGDRVYAAGFLNPKGGFYAEYTGVDASLVSPLPEPLTMAQAGVMSGIALTALRGLEDTLSLKSGEAVMIFGASGGIGHMAVQLAKQMGTRVLAVASGDDGVTLAAWLGADAVVDGRRADVLAAAKSFAPSGLDAALLTAGGEAAARALGAMRAGGRVAYPNGVQPAPQPPFGGQLYSYNGEPDAEILGRLNRLISANRSFKVHIAQTFSLEQAAAAHRALEEHYLGKIALRIR